MSQGQDEDSWATLLDELWKMGISPDSGVECLVCDGNLDIEGAVEIAYPGVKTQGCIWHLLKNAYEVLGKGYPGQRNEERRSHLMEMIRETSAVTSEMEAHARFGPLAREDASLARYL